MVFKFFRTLKTILSSVEYLKGISSTNLLSFFLEQTNNRKADLLILVLRYLAQYTN